MPLFWIALLPVVGGVCAAQDPAPEAGLLSDSELVYEVSGGFAGVVRTAKLAAKEGKVTSVYSERNKGFETGSREPAPYLELWKEAERLGVWTLEVPGKKNGADMFQHVLRARVGERLHSVSWSDSDQSSPAARNALQIGERILALVREASAER
jgi:hypothetical protein